MIGSLRNIEASIEYRLWCILRQRGWFMEKKNVTLTKLTSVNGRPVPANSYGIANGMPWVFLDINGNPWSGGVTIRLNGVQQLPTAYTVNYRDAYISLNSQTTQPVTADVMVAGAHIREGYPDNEWLEARELPVVAFTCEVTTARYHAIGTSLQNRSRHCTISLLGKNKGQAKDLMEEFYRFIVRLPLLDMSEHQPLTYLGTLDTAFNPDSQRDAHDMRLMEPPVAEYLGPRMDGLDKERYRAMVSFIASRVD